VTHEFAYVNGKVLPVGEATVSVLDRSFLYGDGCFDTAVAREGKIFKLDTHIDRLFRSLRALRIDLPLSKAAVRAAAMDLLRRNGMRDGFIRIVVSRGTCRYASVDPRATAGDPTVVMLTRGIDPSTTYGGPSGSAGGIRAIIASVRKTPSASLEARAKSNNYLNSILARLEATTAGVDEAILLDLDGNITEGSGDNIFCVAGNRLRTPPTLNTLEGVTRETILALAPRAGLSAEVCALTPYDLYVGDEVFLTSTVIGVMPVVELDGRRIGEGRPGPVAARIQRLYDDVVRTEGEPI